MFNSKPTIRRIKLDKLILHHSVPFEIRLAIGSIRYNKNYEKTFSTEALLFLLASHPLHVTINSKGIGACFAGLRLFQLAQTYLDPDIIISVLSHTKLSSKAIAEISINDPYLTTLAYGLDNRPWPFQFNKIWGMLKKDTLKCMIGAMF